MSTHTASSCAEPASDRRSGSRPSIAIAKTPVTQTGGDAKAIDAVLPKQSLFVKQQLWNKLLDEISDLPAGLQSVLKK